MQHHISPLEKLFLNFRAHAQLLVGVIVMICLLGVMAVISFQQMRAHDNLAEVRQNAGNTQVEISVRNRSFTAGERDILKNASQMFFETKAFETVVSAQSEKDYRVKTATLIAISANFPLGERLGLKGGAKISGNGAWIEPILAKQLNIEVGDEITIAGETLIYERELTGSLGLQGRFSDQQIVVLDVAERTAVFDERYFTQIDRIYANLDDKISALQTRSLADKLDDDVYISTSSLQPSPQFSAFQSLASLADFQVFGIAFICFLALISHFLYWKKQEGASEKSLLFLPVGIAAICISAFGSIALWALGLFDQRALVSTFLVPMIILVSFAAMAFLNAATTETKKQRVLVCITQLALLGLIFGTLLVSGQSVRLSLLLVFCIFITLLICELSNAFLPKINFSKWGSLLLSLFCTLGLVGLTLGGIQATNDLRSSKAQLLISNVFSSQLEEVSNTLSGLETKEFGSILAQLDAINGSKINSNIADFDVDGLKALVTDRQLQHQALLKGKWWTPFDAQLSVAVSQHFAQSFGIMVNDNLTLHVQRQQVVVKVRAIFNYSMHHAGFSPNILISRNIRDVVNVNTSEILVENGEDASNQIDKLVEIAPDTTILSNKGAVTIKGQLSDQVDAMNRGLEATIVIAWIVIAFVISLVALQLIKAAALKPLAIAILVGASLVSVGIGSFLAVSGIVRAAGWRFGVEAELMSANVWEGIMIYGAIVGLLFIIVYKLSSVKTSTQTS